MNYATEFAPYLEILEKQYQEFLRLLTPYDVVGQTKLRIGPEHDGGYVMLEPGRDGIVYSFGISDYSPWDVEMADRGFKVYQYDGTVDQGPDEHPNIVFNKTNISGAERPPAGEKNLTQILNENGHETATDIILQIDIEGAEWEFFEHITPDQILRFSQIIVEFHDVFNVEKLDHYRAIIKNINLTHCPFHIHYNNYGNHIPCADFIACDPIEVSFVRRDGYSFSLCPSTFPTALDSSNNPELHDILIGNFLSMTRSGWADFVSDKAALVYAAAQRIFYLQDAQTNQLNCIANQNRQLVEVNEQLEALQSRQQAMMHQITMLITRHDELHEQNARLHERNGQLHEQNGQLHEQNGRLHEQNGRLHEQNGRLHEQVSRQEKTIHRLRHPLQRLMSHIAKKT